MHSISTALFLGKIYSKPQKELVFLTTCTDYDVIKGKKIQNGRKFKTKFCWQLVSKLTQNQRNNVNRGRF